MPEAATVSTSSTSSSASSTAERLGKHAEAALRGSLHRDFSHVHCHVACGRAKLRGTVPSFYLKQLAQEIVGKLDGIDAVDNCVEVRGHLHPREQGTD